MMNPPTGIARTLATLLNAGETVPVDDAIRLVKTLAAQIAKLHSQGQFQRGITPAAIALDADWTPTLISADAISSVESPAEARQYLPLDLGHHQLVELPREIAAAERKLLEGGNSLDPRQIDIYSLGAILCRLITGESAASYLRSPRVKRDLPLALRSVVERALGSDGRTRFANAAEFCTALDADLESPATSELDDASPSPEDTPSFHTGDTTPSCVTSKDTATWVPQQAAHDASTNAIPFQTLGHYEIVGRIGHGGMGDVYQGYEQGLDRIVAIKVLPSDLARQSDFIRRFKAEATAAAKLIHPNIIQIYFIGEDAGHHFFAMQYVAGESLAELLHRKTRLGVDETLAIVEQALAGLGAAHKQGLVHRDIKPANILLDREHRRALLADFGLVKSVETSDAGHTATGVVMGTVDYISPEQGRGLAIDCRSDLYSLGVLLYQMLSGRLPFQADSPTALIFQHVYEQPPPLAKTAPDVPPLLAAIIAKLLRKLPADRYQTVDALLTDLRAFRAGQSLPSGADKLPTHDVAVKSGRASMVFAPTDVTVNEPALPGIRDLMPPDWWERARGRAQSLFWKHAPEAIQQLQNTQQQVDGAVARYARQERELRKLAAEAEAVLADLQTQIREHQLAAAQARQQADEGGDAAAIHAAQFAEISAKQLAAGLEKQATEQLDQLGAIKLKLAQAVSKRRELENQRDILNARLKLAGVRVAVESGRTKKSTGNWRVWAGGIAVVVIVVGSYVRFKATREQNGDPAVATKSVLSQSRSNQKAVGATAEVRDLKDVAPLDLRALPLHRLAVSLRSVTDYSGTPQGISFERDPTRIRILTPKSVDTYQIGTWDLVSQQTLQFAKSASNLVASPDRTLVAAGMQSVNGDAAGEVVVCSIDTGRVQQSSPKVHQSVGSVIFSPDGKTVAAIHLDRKKKGYLRLWNVQNMQQHRILADDKFDIQSVAYDPMGKWIAYGTDTGTIRVHNLPSGELRSELKGHGHLVQALAAGPDGHALVSGDDHGRLLLWDASTGQQLGEFAAHTKAIEALAIAADGRLLASSDSGATLIWDMSAGIVRAVLDTQDKPQLTFDPLGRFLVTIDSIESAGARASVWNAQLTAAPYVKRTYADGVRLKIPPKLELPPVELNDIHVIYASESTGFLYDRQLKIGSPRFKGHTSPIRGMALSVNRSTLVTGAEDGEIRFWNATSGVEIGKVSIPSDGDAPARAIRHLSISDEGRFAAATTSRGLFIAESAGTTTVAPHDCALEQITSLAWLSSKEKLVLVGGRDPNMARSSVILWDVAKRSIQTRVDLSSAPVDWVSPANGGTSFACASGGIIRLYDLASGRVSREWKLPEGQGQGQASAFAMSPNGRHIAVANGIRLGFWDANSGTEFLRFARNVSAPSFKSINFTASGSAVLTLDESQHLSTYSFVGIDSEVVLNRSVFSDALASLREPWELAAMSTGGREALLQCFQLDQNPLRHLNGPPNDLDLANFSTDGGWWINQGALIRQPGARHVTVDLGEHFNFSVQTEMVLPGRQRLFLLFNWDGSRGYCLTPSTLDRGTEWVLASLPDGGSRQLTVPQVVRQSMVDGKPVTFAVRNGELLFDAGSALNSRATYPIPDQRSGRVLLGLVDDGSNEAPARILSLKVSQF